MSPSPVALFLLGLAERGADGSVALGGRQLLLRKGQVVDVHPAAGDGDLATFLRESGRVPPEPLERCTNRARTEGVSLEEVLVRQRVLGADTVRDARRALWLDRLVRAMALAETQGEAPRLEDAPTLPTEQGASLVSLVLDALERRAAEHDAGLVGGRADHRVEWLPSAHLERARRWARFDASLEQPLVAALLKTEPAAAPRIAALVRAGLARMASPDAPSARPTPKPPAPSPQAAASSTPTPRPPIPTPAGIELRDEPRRASVDLLGPGRSPVFAAERLPLVELPSFAAPIAVLDDPLDRLERHIAVLEETGASGAERAAAWRRFGDAWLDRFGAIEEAARAHREAASADGDDASALERASELCGALGQADLAVAYDRAAVAKAPAGPERARALTRHALLCRQLGKLSEALGALRAAASVDPADPEPLALSAHLWRELGRAKDAAHAAAEAAERIRERDPTRALALAAFALDLEPRASARAEAYAKELARNGLHDAAIAVRADAARHEQEPDVRRDLLLAAAQQAELADRPHIAAELLARAFDAEPHVDLVYEPLDADLALAEAPVERAVMLEEIAVAAAPEAQAAWLVRAAQARFELPGDGAIEAELWARALELAPDDGTCMRALREQATARDEPRLLADAIERAIVRGRWTAAGPQRAALEELARLSEALDAPLRAASAWQRLAALAPDDPAPARQLARLAPALREHQKRGEALEREHAQEKNEHAARRLADHLRDDPERRGQALGIYRSLLREQPSDASLGDSAERLCRLLGDESAHAEVLALRALHAANRADRVRLELRRASLAALGARFGEAADACRRILAKLPSHREASIRLRRAASRLADRDLTREALAAEAQLALPAQPRARVLTALALELEAAGSVDEAISCAEGALSADMASAEAALLVTRHLEALEQPRAALGVVRALVGDSPPILEAWARVARDAGERDAMLEALEGWARGAPYDPEPCVMRLSAFPSAETTDSLVQSIEGALAPERLVPSLARPVASALERLAERGELVRAARLAVRASDAFGPHGEALRELAGELARRTDDHALERDALERRIAPQIEDARVELLHELAAAHRAAGDREAEARAHLRVIAVRRLEPRSLSRLDALYAETGEIDRLMAVLALERDAEPDRFAPLLRLASATATLRGDPDRAEALLREAWSPEHAGESALFEAAGALVTLGRARRAVELLREAGRSLPPERAAPVLLRALETARTTVGDARLALSTAMEGLELAPGSGRMLIAFEQLAIELSDVDVAERTYRRLTDRAMGPHGRRAIGYRRARWLEHAGLGRAALEAYLEAFAQEPQAGVVYTSVERLAREHGDLEALIRATMLLAEHARHPAVRATMARRAAHVLEHELASPERAFGVLAQQWEGGDASVEDDLGRLAAALRAHDPATGEAAFERLLAELRRRAEDAWMADAKARLLLRQGRLHALGRGDLDAAQAAVDEGLEAMREEGGEPDLVASLEHELASWLADAGALDRAAARVSAALAAYPRHEPARALATRLGVELPPIPPPEDLLDLEDAPIEEPPEPPGEPAAAAPSAELDEGVGDSEEGGGDSHEGVGSTDEGVGSTDEGVASSNGGFGNSGAGTSDHDASEPDHDAGIGSGDARSGDDGEDPAGVGESSANGGEAPGDPAPTPSSAAEGSSSVDALESRSAPQAPIGGIADAGARVVLEPGASMSSSARVPTHVLRPPGRADTAMAVGGWVSAPPPTTEPDLDAGSSRARTLSSLREAIVREPHRVELTRELSSLEGVPPDAAERRLARSLLGMGDEGLPHASVRALETRVRELGSPRIRQLWRLLWEHALPLFRETPARPPEPNDRVTRVATTPEARAFGAALEALGHEDLPPFYLDRSGEPRLVVLRTAPPCLLAGPGFAQGERAMRFALGRMLELADPEHVLVATLPEARARTLIAAVSAAFGPADGGPVPREAAMLASELYRTMAARAQGAVRDLLAETRGFDDYDATRRAAEENAARSGLLACGDLGAAVRALAEVDPLLSSLDLSNDEGLGALLERSEAAAGLVRFVFGSLWSS